MRSAIQIPNYPLMQTECTKCGMLLSPDAGYCSRCGASQSVSGHVRRPPLVSLATGTIIAALLGVACLVAALVTGALFNQQNLADWQAVQVWRIQWLLGGIAFFLLACFLALVRRTQ